MASYYETAKLVQAAERAQRETSRQAFRVADCARMLRAYQGRLSLALERGNAAEIERCKHAIAETQRIQADANDKRSKAFKRWNDCRAKLG